MTDALVWELVKNNNAFLVKRNRTSRDGAVQFSSEPGNLLNVNSFKYSGLANSKAVDVSVKDKAITLKLKVCLNYDVLI
jgi:large subunit ribosomal protein L28e